MFFCSIGWLPEHFGLLGTAIVGRLVGLFILAVGWVSFGKRVTASNTAVLLGILGYLGLFQLGTLSGEWLVGGIEGKVPAWGSALFGVAFALDRRWLRFGIHAGIATAFHPVVGAWLVLAIAGCEAIRTVAGDPPWSESRGKRLLAGSLIACALSAPGLVPALSVLRPPEVVPPNLLDKVSDVHELVSQADSIQVYGRLKHHLDPMDFEPSGWWRYGVLLVAWLLLARRRPELVRLHLIVLAGTLFALAAVAIAYGPRPAMDMPGYAWKAKVLKLYPFRFIDALLPIVVALELGKLIAARLGRKQTWLASTAICALVFAAPVIRQLQPAKNLHSDWLDACSWIRANALMESICVTPRESLDFKWYAERPEFVNYKDCPQDAVGIVEWNRRLWLLQHWRQQSLIGDDAYSRDELAEFRRLTGASYLVTRRIEPILVEPTYRNSTYRIYQLPEPEEP